MKRGIAALTVCSFLLTAGCSAGSTLSKVKDLASGKTAKEIEDFQKKAEAAQKLTYTAKYDSVSPGNKTEKITITRAVIDVPSVLGDSRKPDDTWDFMYDKEKKIGQGDPAPTVRVRAWKWVVADPDKVRAPEGWRALTWYDVRNRFLKNQSDLHVIAYTGITTSAVGADRVLHFTVGTKSYTFTLPTTADLSDFGGNAQAIGNNVSVKVKVQVPANTVVSVANSNA